MKTFLITILLLLCCNVCKSADLNFAEYLALINDAVNNKNYNEALALCDEALYLNEYYI